MACYNGPDHTWASMLDEAARWDDLVIGLRPMLYGAKGDLARCLVSVGPTTTTKASSERWRIRLRPNSDSLAKASVSGRYPWKLSKNLSRRLLQESMDNGGNLVYQVKAGPSRAMMKDLAIVASSPPDDATTT